MHKLGNIVSNYYPTFCLLINKQAFLLAKLALKDIIFFMSMNRAAAFLVLAANSFLLASKQTAS